jgi:hypothetical protein
MIVRSTKTISAMKYVATAQCTKQAICRCKARLLSSYVLLTVLEQVAAADSNILHAVCNGSYRFCGSCCHMM